jgi:hypothetical protein
MYFKFDKFKLFKKNNNFKLLLFRVHF